MKKVSPGSRADFEQALAILSTAREHDEYVRRTLGTSKYVRAAYFRIFGKPRANDIKIKGKDGIFDLWSHDLTDGKISLLGHYLVPDDKEYMVIYPPKKQ